MWKSLMYRFVVLVIFVFSLFTLSPKSYAQQQTKLDKDTWQAIKVYRMKAKRDVRACKANYRRG